MAESAMYTTDPSGGEVAKALAATVPPAPGLLSTTTA
jgi:hypothetical protein